LGRDCTAHSRFWHEHVISDCPLSAGCWAEKRTTSAHAEQRALPDLRVPLEQAIAEQSQYPAVRALQASEDHIEGPRAFAEKRPPKWTQVNAASPIEPHLPASRAGSVSPIFWRNRSNAGIQASGLLPKLVWPSRPCGGSCTNCALPPARTKL